MKRLALGLYSGLDKLVGTGRPPDKMCVRLLASVLQPLAAADAGSARDAIVWARNLKKAIDESCER